MSARSTSVETFRQIADEGLLSAMRMRCYDALYRACVSQPKTAQEIAEHYPSDVRSSSVGLNLHARLGELLARGVVAECAERLCSVTGRNVTTWTTTNCLPREILWRGKKPTKLQAARIEIKRLTEQMQRVQDRCDYLERSNQRLRSGKKQLGLFAQ